MTVASYSSEDKWLNVAIYESAAQDTTSFPKLAGIYSNNKCVKKKRLPNAIFNLRCSSD